MSTRGCDESKQAVGVDEVGDYAALRYDFGLKFEKTNRFHDIHTDHEGTLILDLTKATPAYHGHRIEAFHNERKEKQHANAK